MHTELSPIVLFEVHGRVRIVHKLSYLVTVQSIVPATFEICSWRVIYWCM